MESWFALPAEQRFSNLISTLNHDIRNVFFAFIFSKEPKTQGQIRKEFLEITKLDETKITKDNKNSLLVAYPHTKVRGFHATRFIASF